MWSHLASTINEGYWKAGLLSLLGAELLLLCYRVFFHPLARFPGPKIASLTGLWRLYHYVIGDWHEIILPLHQKYGRIVRLAPNELSVVDESAMKTLYGHGTAAIKSDWYRTWQPPGAAPNIMATQDPKVHAEVRRRMAPAFKMTAILRMEDSMQKCLDEIWQHLHEPASEGATVDMCYWIDALAWNVIGELCYGQPLGLTKDPVAKILRQNIFSSFVVSTILGHVWGQLSWVENFMTRLLGVKSPIIKFIDWSSAQISKHQQDSDSERPEDIIDHLLAYVDSKGRSSTHAEVVDALTAAIAAGADTVAIAMRSALYYLSTNPDVLQKLQAEIDSLDSTEAISYKQTQQLPYLKAVVRESLRMYPSIPAQLYRFLPADGLTVDGQYIPPGTIVGISSAAQNRDSAVFGSDINIFNPERWVGDEAHARYLENALFNFGGTGPRACPGRDLAMIEMYKVVAQFVQKFEFKVLDEKHPFSEKTYFFTFQSDMPVKLALR